MSKRLKTNYNLILLFFSAFLLRAFLSFLPGFGVDMSAWFGWAQRLVSFGLARFYDPKLWTHYTPGYLYVLFVLGKIKEVFGLSPQLSLQLFKLPTNLADIFSAFLVYKILAKKNQKLALLGAVFYLFNPALIFNSSIWGQADSFLTLLLLLSFYFLVEKRGVFLSAVFIALAFLNKPQALFLLPVLFLTLVKDFKGLGWGKFILIFLATVFLGALPFFPAQPILGLPALIWQMGKDYPYTTLNAFNFWQLFGNWQSDTALFLGLTKQLWGFFIFLLAESVVLIKLWVSHKSNPMSLRGPCTVWYRGRSNLRDCRASPSASSGFARNDKRKASLYLAAFLSFFAFFLFLTRIHERYLLPALVFLLIAAILYKSFSLLFSYILLTGIHFLNLYYVYCHYQANFLKIDFFYQLIQGNIFILSLLTIFIFFALLLFFVKPSFLTRMDKSFAKFWKKFARQFLEPAIPSHPVCAAGDPSDGPATFDCGATPHRVWFLAGSSLGSLRKEKVKKGKVFLLLILGFAFLSRVINLGYPKAYVFDEVYHAFTAQEMVKGNKAAWEWWNTPPKGFAYEWTHPPMAKLIMAGGIIVNSKFKIPAQGWSAFGGKNSKLLNENIESDFFSWRFPATVFGTGVVFLTYLLAKELLKSEKVALIASFLLSCEGLTLVMSRVGMSDIYFLFFALLTLLFALKKKWFLTGTFWGLALATKWTGMYLLPVVLLIYLANKPNWANLANWTNRLGLAVLPPLVYLASYSLFFTSGHTFKQFVELQKQMWSYHTNLKATHNYQSTPLTWIFNLRPVWFYVNYKENAVGNIYALGNPIIFWTGLVFLPLFIYETVVRRLKGFFLTLLAYFIFWLPWIFSPRIMFLYHYLPSLPFLVMILAWGINTLARGRKGKLLAASYYLLATLSFFFFYPLWTGTPVSKNFLNYLFWLPTWK